MTKVSLVLGLILVPLLLLMGFLALFTDVLHEHVNGPNKLVLGIIVILYAIWRSVRLYKLFQFHKEQKRHD